MITVTCACGHATETPEAGANRRYSCPSCGKTIQLVCAEALPPDTGIGDFDARLEVRSGPSRGGEWIALGGCAEITVGKLDTNSIRLPGTRVSRLHCRLARIDFGPSRWKLIDNHSTNGLFVNGQRVAEHDLADGDVIRIGEYELLFGNAPPKPATAPDVGASAQAPGRSGQRTCPSCGKAVGSRAKVCVECGVDLATGRPLVVSQGVDENSVHVNAETAITWVSWLVPVTPLPMPLISEAYGSHKPNAIRAIAILTTIASLLFVIYTWENPVQTGRELLLWPPGMAESGRSVVDLPRRMVDDIVQSLDDEGRAVLAQKEKELKGKVPDRDLTWRAVEAMVAEVAGAGKPEAFHWYQLFTHAMLHDNSSVLGFAMHLGGNMLFLLVFGTRVNALLGDLPTAIVYPILAAAAAGGYLIFGNPHSPMLGASGAINGLAGMYLVLFPVNRVYCAMWLRLRFWVTFKIFTLRGFWVLAIYFAYDSLMAYVSGRTGGGGVAHWAHIGGFVSGMIIALGLLFSRLMYCGGGDLLSVTLGKRAWALIGKPSRWSAEPA